MLKRVQHDGEIELLPITDIQILFQYISLLLFKDLQTYQQTLDLLYSSFLT